MFYSPAYNPRFMWSIDPERLQAAMDRARLNQSQLAEQVGIKQPSIGRLLSGETKTTRALERIARVLDTTSAYLTGETDNPGASEFTATREARESLARQLASRSERQNDDLVKVAEIDPKFGLGGAFMDEHAVPEMRTFSRAWLRQITTSPPDELYWARGRGDSMEPTIGDGDVCLIDRSETSPEKFGDTYWAIAYGHTGMIKRLRPMPDGSVKILSNNPSVPPETAYEGELHVFGRVVAVVKKV